jgi:ribosome-associated protein
MNDQDLVSKTRRKKDMHALQQLGVELVKLPAARLEKLDLPEALREAVSDARRFNAREALRRQMQYIGRLMRDVDAAHIAEQLAAWRGASDQETARQHQLERWREKLLASDEALTEWLAEHPGSDSQRLRTLIRNARQEAAQGKPPKSGRELFRLLRQSVETG